MSPIIVVTIVWALWLLSWIAAAFWADRAINRPSGGEQLLYRVVTLVGAALMFARFSGLHHIGRRLWAPGRALDDALIVVIVLGLLFTWWARLYLGPLWSSSVTRKADHRVVDTGPYGIVRHPIYTGIIVAVIATAIIEDAPIRIVGALLMIWGFWIKARLEERFLREQLGSEAYDSYRRRVPMLIPFGPTSGRD